MTASGPLQTRIQEGFAVAALVMGDPEGALLDGGLVAGASIAEALLAQRALGRGDRRALLRAVLRRRSEPQKPVLAVRARLAARAATLLAASNEERPIDRASLPAPVRTRRGFAADPQLVAWLGRAWSSALRAEER
jgi:hypothetical protein